MSILNYTTYTFFMIWGKSNSRFIQKVRTLWVEDTYVMGKRYVRFG